MRISLRKARKLEQKIANHIKTLTPKFTGVVSRWDARAPEEAYDDLVNKSVATIQLVLELHRIRIELRTAISHENDFAITNVIAQKKLAETQREFLKQIVTESEYDFPNHDTIAITRDGLRQKYASLFAIPRNAPADATGRTIESFKFSVLTEDTRQEIEHKIVQLTSTIESCEDQLLSLNTAGHVDVSDLNLAVLAEVHITV